MNSLYFTIFLSLGMVSHAYADSETTLWVPESMIIGQTYHGMILVDRATPEGLLLLLSTGADHIVDVPASVSIPPYKNHGIFTITPLSKGITNIFVTAGETGLQTTQTEVISPKSEPANLKIVLASEKTLADSMLAYVLVLDENGAPVKVDNNLNIHLATSSSIGSPSNLIIKNNTYYSQLEMSIRGTGHIIASSDGLKPDRADIHKAQNDITVKLAVAPDIAMSDSYVYYYVWLEKDGKPFRPPYVVDTFLHSGNPNAARFSPNPLLDDYEGVLVRLVDGVSKGILYTGNRGHATVTASTTEFGSGHDSLFVGPAKVDISDGDTTVLIHQQNLVGKIDDSKSSPNLLLSWIYPSVTDDVAWAVVATYSADKTRSLDMVVDGGEISSTIIEDTTITPARPDGRTVIYASSNGGIIHDGAYRMEESLTKTNAMEFEISGSSHGEHTLTVSGQGLESGIATVSIVPEYSEKFSLDITPIPSLPHTMQDLAIISVLDELGSMVDVSETFGVDAEFLIHSDSARVSDDVTPIRSNSAIVRGILAGSSHITAILDGVDSASAEITPSRTATSLEILAPDTVHIDEKFPFIVHLIDHVGNPIDRATNLRVSSSLDVSMDDDYMTIRGGSGNGRISIISGIGAAEHEISGIANTMNIDLKFDRTEMRVGNDVIFEVINTVDAMYDLFTDFPFVQTGDSTFVITPDKEDDSAVITLQATRKGYEPVSITETFDVKKIFIIDIRAVDPDGSRLAIPFDLYLDGSKSLAQSPYHAEIQPSQIGIDLPEKHAIHGHGYAIKSILINDREHAYGDILDVFLTQDFTVEAVYAREILVNVADGQGSGVYEYGDIVTIDAPDREKLSFLVRDVFDHWEGVDGTDSKQTFVATQDISVIAVYMEDYTYLMAIITIPLLGIGMIVVFRNTTSFRWKIENMLERMSVLIGSVKSKKKRKPTDTRTQ